MVGAVANPERFLIVHWSNPAHSIPGVEIVVGPDTSPAVVESVNAMLAVAGRVGAVVGDMPGFVLNRLQYALVREALLVVEEGVATPEAVDTLMRTILGFRMPFVPPLTMLDMAGLDVYVSGFAIVEEAFGERLSAPQILKDAVADGRHGMKNGRGLWRDYPPEAVAEIVEWRGRAYARMKEVLDELGPIPLPEKAARHERGSDHGHTRPRRRTRGRSGPPRSCSGGPRPTVGTSRRRVRARGVGPSRRSPKPASPRST